jgi:hypothetical protein
VHITSEAPWDPNVLDHIPPIEWYKSQPQSLTLIEESSYDQHGECNESTRCVAKKDEKALDAETPTDDLNYNTSKETLTDTPIETSKSDMRAHLHNLIQDEIVPEHRVFFVGRHILKVDINHREAHLIRRSPREHPTTVNLSVRLGCSPRDHPPPVDCPVKPRARKKSAILIPPVRDAPVGTPIKTMDGNLLGQNKDLSPDDQAKTRTDYNNPAKINNHEMDLRLWMAAPCTKLKKVEATEYKKFFFGMPTKTFKKTFNTTM